MDTDAQGHQRIRPDVNGKIHWKQEEKTKKLLKTAGHA